MRTIPIFSLLMLCIAVFVIAPVSNGQTGCIMGVVKDKNTDEPLPFGNVIVNREDTFYSGVATDIDGKYRLPLEPGTYDIIAQYIGYAPVEIENVVVKDAIVVLDLIVEVKAELLDAVEISSDVVHCSEAKMEVSYMMVESYDASSGVMRSAKSAEGSNAVVVVRAVSNEGQGILTAGQVNDFSKWDLWQDVADNDLRKWQERWDLAPLNRYTVQVVSQEGKPLADAVVSLIGKNGSLIWTSRTDNTGKAELWAGIFKDKKDKENYSIRVSWKDRLYESEKITKFSQGINLIKIPESCDVPQNIDILFAVDATSSMADEIEYLKAELMDIINVTASKYPEYTIRLGCVFYRDDGDEYVTRKFDFTTNIKSVIDFIKEQYAAGGGDYPEAVDSALDVAVNQMDWSSNALSRMLFMVLDAPPHFSPKVISSLQGSIKSAAKMGIRIIPITGSGIDEEAEYILRSAALATNGTYIFLTDHSGVGGSHITPTTDEYDVQLLNELLVKIIYEYIFIPPCNGNFDKQEIKDTMIVYNPKIIAHEIADSSLLGRYGASVLTSDTNIILITDPDEVLILQAKNDSIEAAIRGNEEFHNFKYYPNPTVGDINIEIEGSIKEMYLADISGKLLERYQINSDKLLINISKYPSGIYFLNYFCNNKWLSGKVVLLH